MFNPITKRVARSGLVFMALLGTVVAAAAAQPVDWQMWLQPAASKGMIWIDDFAALTFWVIVPITLLVTFLLGFVLFKFRASANPVPSKVTHNTTIEIIWTLAPILILLIIAIPSFKLLTFQLVPPVNPAVTIKATGYQWYWGFEYQGDKEVAFETRLIGREDGTPESIQKANAEREEFGKSDLAIYPRLLAVDNEIVVPVGKTIRVLVTADDVIHAFALPAFGLKLDAFPGRLNELHFTPDKIGLYYGQCSELCGRDHAYMPLAIRVVTDEQYAAWLDKAANDVEGANKDLMAAIAATSNNIKVAGN